MVYKQFFWSMVSVSFAIFFANLILWNTQTNCIFEQEKKLQHGDLARIGYLRTSIPLLPEKKKPEKKHIEIGDYSLSSERVDILTIGDSFFNGHAGFYFQDILAGEFGYTVLNVPCPLGYEAVDILSMLLRSGYYEEISPKFVIIESVGRFCIDRYGRLPIDVTDMLQPQISREELKNIYMGKEKIKSNKSFIDPRMYDGNVKFLQSKTNQTMGKKEINNSVTLVDLSRDFFTNIGQESKMLYYTEDVKKISLVNSVSVKKVQENLNAVAQLLQLYDTKLVFLLAVDKYDLYSDYIVNGPKLNNPLFEYMRQTNKNYIFVDTKAILRNELEKGEQDIYWMDDTHWSWKGQEAVATQLVKQIAGVQK